jgi:hypothetical protein
MNLKQPTRLDGKVHYKSSDKLEKQWENSPHLTVIMDDDITERYIQELEDKALIFYFSNNPPQFRTFTDWAEWAFTQQQGWKINHIKYLGRNFFFVLFDKPEDKILAETSARWYLNWRNMYTFPWHTTFNVHTEFLVQAPVWIELQFRDLIFEPQRRKLVEQLGPILHYTRADKWSTYPNDRVCVLWDLQQTVPEHIKIVHSNLTLWQPIDFKTLPQMCFICRADNHLSHTCPQCPIKVEPLLYDPASRFNKKPSLSRVIPESKNNKKEYQSLQHECKQKDPDNRTNTSMKTVDSLNLEAQTDTSQEKQRSNTSLNSPSPRRYAPMEQVTNSPKHSKQDFEKREVDIVSERLGINTTQGDSSALRQESKQENSDSQEFLVQTIALQSNIPVLQMSPEFTNRSLNSQFQKVCQEQTLNNIADRALHNHLRKQFQENEYESDTNGENKKENCRIPGPEKQSFKQLRRHPYGGIRQGKSKMSIIIYKLKHKGRLSQIKQQLSDIYNNSSTELSMPQFINKNMSTEDEEMNTTTDSIDQSTNDISSHSTFAALLNIFGSTNT